MFLRIKEYTIHIETSGTGSPMICLHGLNLNQKMFHEYSIVNYFQNYQRIAVDLPGYGDSEWIPNLTFDTMELIISSILAKFNLYKISLCGYCLGGIFALDYSIRHPDKIENLYLIETMIYYKPWMDICSWKMFGALYSTAWRFGIMKMLEKIPSYKNISSIQSMGLLGQKWNVQINTHYLKLMKSYKLNHLSRSKVIRCPVEMIYGSNTWGNVIRTYRDLRKVLKKSVEIRVEGAGHLVFLDL